MTIELTKVTKEQIEVTSPSFYTAGPKPGGLRGGSFIGSHVISNMIEKRGWILLDAWDSDRSAENRGYSRHQLVWGHPDYHSQSDAIVLIGTNTRRKKDCFIFTPGVKRGNSGMIFYTPTKDFKSISIDTFTLIHRQMDRLIEKMTEAAQDLSNIIPVMKRLPISDDKQRRFGQKAVAFLYPDQSGSMGRQFKFNQFLKARRDSDRSKQRIRFKVPGPVKNVWTTFIVITENAYRGVDRVTWENMHGAGITSFRKQQAICEYFWSLIMREYNKTIAIKSEAVVTRSSENLHTISSDFLVSSNHEQLWDSNDAVREAPVTWRSFDLATGQYTLHNSEASRVAPLIEIIPTAPLPPDDRADQLLREERYDMLRDMIAEYSRDDDIPF